MNVTRTFFRTTAALLAVLLLGTAFSARAHDPGLSTAMMVMLPDRVEVTLAFAIKDAGQLVSLDQNGDGLVSKEEFANGQEKLEALAADEFSVAFDTHPIKPATQRSQLDAQDNVEIILTFAAHTFTNLTAQSKLLARLAAGHRQFFTLEKPGDKPLVEQLLSATADTVTSEVGPRNAAPLPAGKNSFENFLMMGVEHIWTGYDHLLFLFGLMIVTRNFRAALKIITCFTIAHSLTLAIATLNLVQISTRIVEPLIAASLVYVGVENLFSGGEPKGRWILTFAFGLIHGFGFASVLRNLGVGANGSSIAGPLVSFNLGVELGQLAVAAIALPVIWKLRTWPVFVKRWVPAASVLVALLGTFWFVQRVWSS